MIDYASVTRSFVMWRNEKKILVLPSQVIAKIIDQILRNNRWHFELFKTYIKVIFSYVAQALCNASSNGGGGVFFLFFVFLSSKCWSKGAFFYAVVGVNTIHLFPGPTEAAPLIPFQIRRPRFWTLRKQKFKKRRSTHKVQECRISLWKPARRPPRGPAGNYRSPLWSGHSETAFQPRSLPVAVCDDPVILLQNNVCDNARHSLRGFSYFF